MRVREKPKRVLPARREVAGAVQRNAPDESGAEVLAKLGCGLCGERQRRLGWFRAWLRVGLVQVLG